MAMAGGRPFWVLLVVGALAALVIALLIPSVRQEDREESNLRAELAAAVRPIVLICYANIALLMIGFFCVVAYIAPFLTDAVGIPMDGVPWVLFAISIAGFGGNLLGGLAGRHQPQSDDDRLDLRGGRPVFRPVAVRDQHAGRGRHHVLRLDLRLRLRCAHANPRFCGKWPTRPISPPR